MSTWNYGKSDVITVADYDIYYTPSIEEIEGTLKEKTHQICDKSFENIKHCIQAAYCYIQTEAEKEKGYVKNVENYLFDKYGNGHVLNKGVTYSTSIDDLSDAYNPFVIVKQTMEIYIDDKLVDTVFHVDCDFSTLNMV